jgi:hypothetical protein
MDEYIKNNNILLNDIIDNTDYNVLLNIAIKRKDIVFVKLLFDKYPKLCEIDDIYNVIITNDINFCNDFLDLIANKNELLHINFEKNDYFVNFYNAYPDIIKLIFTKLYKYRFGGIVLYMLKLRTPYINLLWDLGEEDKIIKYLFWYDLEREQYFVSRLLMPTRYDKEYKDININFLFDKVVNCAAHKYFKLEKTFNYFDFVPILSTSNIKNLVKYGMIQTNIPAEYYTIIMNALILEITNNHRWKSRVFRQDKTDMICNRLKLYVRLLMRYKIQININSLDKFPLYNNLWFLNYIVSLGLTAPSSDHHQFII